MSVVLFLEGLVFFLSLIDSGFYSFSTFSPMRFPKLAKEEFYGATPIRAECSRALTYYILSVYESQYFFSVTDDGNASDNCRAGHYCMSIERCP